MIHFFCSFLDVWHVILRTIEDFDGAQISEIEHWEYDENWKFLNKEKVEHQFRGPFNQYYRGIEDSRIFLYKEELWLMGNYPTIGAI